MQQGHTYAADEAPPIPQTGDGAAPPQYQYAPPQGQPQAVAVVVGGGAPIQIGQAQGQGQAVPMSSDEMYARQLQAAEMRNAYGQPQAQPQAMPYAPGGAQVMTPIQPQYYGGQPLAPMAPMGAVAMGVPVGGAYGQPGMGQAQPQMYYPPGANGQPYAVHAVAIGGVAGGFRQPFMAGANLRPGMPGHLPQGFWSDDLCSCASDCASCMWSWLFSPYRWATTMAQAKLTGGFGSAFAMYFIPWLLLLVFYFLSEVLWWSAWIALMCHLFLVFLGCSFRGRLRYVYQIAGDPCGDCCMHCCCTCCAIAQEARHVDRDHGLIPPVGGGAAVYR